MSDFWQGPGNGKGFDAKLGANTKMNNRTLGVLSYIKEHSQESGYVSQEQFEREIKAYLQTHFYENPNESLPSHFYKPALFYGFLHMNKDANISLSIEGNLFLTHYKRGEYLTCKKLIINQLDNTTYPNRATPKVKTLKLFPFRILFKILLKSESVSSAFVSLALVHIKEYSDVALYEKSGDLADIQSFESDSSKYKKFNTWVINSLVDLEILKLENKILSIHQDVREHIHLLYDRVTFKDMFFESSSCELEEKIAHKRVKRDFTLITEAKKRDKYLCCVDKNHLTFLSNGNNYVEGHHVIPMFQQKNYNFKLDDVDNIRSLCPNCHREIHSADNKTEILTKLYSINREYMSQNGVNLHELFTMYSCA